MPHAMHLISNSVPGYGPLDRRCLPCSGISRRAVAVSPCPFHADQRMHSQVKTGFLKRVPKGVSFVCKASSSGQRRNPDFSRQNKHGFRGRNRQHEERDSFESLDESEILSLKNGPLLSLSNSPKFQATAAPGPREKEIVELFRKVQAQLRERAALKEDKKIETSQGQGKPSETVDSLLKLLRKHSVEQGKRQGSSKSSRDYADRREQSGDYSEDNSMSFFDSRSKVRDEAPEQSASSLARPASKFRRKSPVPQVKFEPVYSSENTVNSVSHSYSSLKTKKNQVVSDPEPEYEPEAEPLPELEVELESELDPGLELESEPELDPQSIYQDAETVDEVLDVEIGGNEDEKEQDLNEHEDLSALKLTELRALAKSRGVKGFSKMKKGVLLELLSPN